MKNVKGFGLTPLLRDCRGYMPYIKQNMNLEINKSPCFYSILEVLCIIETCKAHALALMSPVVTCCHLGFSTVSQLMNLEINKYHSVISTMIS